MRTPSSSWSVTRSAFFSYTTLTARRSPNWNRRACDRAASMCSSVTVTFALGLIMHLLPQDNQFFEMLGSHVQDAAHRTAFCVGRADGVRPDCQTYSSVVTQIDHHFGLLEKPVDVARRVVLRICHEQHAAESTRRKC